MSMAQFFDNLGYIGVDLPRDILKVAQCQLLHVYMYVLCTLCLNSIYTYYTLHSSIIIKAFFW